MDKQKIENESLTNGGTPEEGAYATTHEEVRQGYPVFGRIAGYSEGLEEVEIHIPYTHRLKWKSISYEKNIKAGIYSLFTSPEMDIKLTFRIKSSQSGSKAMENKEDPAPAGPARSKDHYEQRCLRLEGELHGRTASRQIKQLLQGGSGGRVGSLNRIFFCLKVCHRGFSTKGQKNNDKLKSSL